jgi:serine/threonine-protein kinase RsbW
LNDLFAQCEFDGRELILRLERTIPGHVSAIGPVVEQVMRAVGQMGCAEGKEFEIETALQEALANAVVHGCEGDPEKQVQFVVACDDERGMLIVVRDPGVGFDPATIPSPVVGKCIFAEHGRGIYLINQLMDEVRFDEGGTVIRMRKQ